MKRMILTTCVLVLGFASASYGQDYIETNVDEAAEVQISQKARKRLYPGGRDEENLRVQNQLANPVRELAPQAEIKEDSVEE